MISNELYVLLSRWQRDATGFYPSKLVTDNGLCDYLERRQASYACIQEFQKLRWKEFGPHYLLPFNESYEQYMSQKGFHHQNEQRLTWVKALLDDGKSKHPMISVDLYHVLLAWREEANSDKPAYEVREAGLCAWAKQHRRYAELHAALVRDFGMNSYPFDGTAIAYMNAHDLHRNPQRRAWVDKMIALYEEQHNG